MKIILKLDRRQHVFKITDGMLHNEDDSPLLAREAVEVEITFDDPKRIAELADEMSNAIENAWIELGAAMESLPKRRDQSFNKLVSRVLAKLTTVREDYSKSEPVPMKITLEVES